LGREAGMKARHRFWPRAYRDRASANDGYANLVALWTLRYVVNRRAVRSPANLDWVSMLEPILTGAESSFVLEDEFPMRPISAGKLVEKASRRLAQLERAPVKPHGTLFANAERMAEVLGLDPAAHELLCLACIADLNEGLSRCLDLASTLSVRELRETLGTMLAVDPVRLEPAIDPAGPLSASGVLRVSHDWDQGRLTLKLMDGLTDVFLSEHASNDALLARFFCPSPASGLGSDDFPHMRQELVLVSRFLRAALASRTAGVNVLLYGPPGTGKTEFARVVAAASGVGLHAVNVQDGEGGPASRERRLSSYQLCQRLLARAGTSLVLFDECEDAFPMDGGGLSLIFGGAPRPGREKGWTTRLLETNPVPAIWISNETQHMDPAYVRRFDLALEMRNPPSAVRQRILRKHLAELPVQGACIDRMSANEHVTPADVDRAARVLRLIDVDEAEATYTFERVIDGRLAVRAQPTMPATYALDREAYDLAFVNADRDLERLVGALERRPRGSICLYGPPGTGKSAFVHHAAERLQLPLVAKRASDLLNCFVGSTEKNLAAMFREAKAQSAILLLDEADSFLRDRRGALHSWEVSAVNELLVQLECFQGLLFCATNLFEDLDDASLRRFDLKIAFDFLTIEQREALFHRTLAVLGGAAPDARIAPEIASALRRLDNLTPGDFATVRRQARVFGEVLDAAGLLQRLEAESRAKRGGREKAIGFGV
jgi:transitional endoplasmic reticulum ATPase